MNYDKKKYIQASGDLFNDVQSNRIFNDSKTFVDSLPKKNPSEIIDEYTFQKTKPGFNLKDFVIDNFLLPEDEKIELKLPPGRNMEEHITYLWNYLIRKPLKESSKYSTLIPLPEDYIVPGGRFREVYYWDSYFTMLGLFTGRRYELINNIIKNFSYLIDKFGFIPNGNRVYYLSRSQPPLFALMVTLLSKIKDKIIPEYDYTTLLEKEYNFWMRSNESELAANKKSLHVVKIDDKSLLNRYYDTEKLPREESFYEDLSTFSKVDNNKINLYENIRAAAESGWDFSSRWFDDEENLNTITTANIIPVDLNCLLGYYELYLSNLFGIAGDRLKTELFKERFQKRMEMIRTIFWNSEEGYFFDYNFKTKKQMSTFSLAGVFPLYFGFADREQAESVVKIIETIFLKDGGLTTTPNKTHQQWDAPNGWPPLQWITIIGLRNYGFNELADKIKNRWLKLNELVFRQTGKMFEKYNVEDITIPGGGGEYALQDGFGWTNGVASALLKNLDYEFIFNI